MYRKWFTLLAGVFFFVVPVLNFTQLFEYESLKSAIHNSQSSMLDVLQHRTQQQLINSLNALTRYPQQVGSEQFYLRALYERLLDQDTRNKEKLTPIIRLFKRIDAIQDHKDLQIFNVQMLREGRESPFLYWSVAPDYRDSKRYALYLLGPNIHFISLSQIKRILWYVANDVHNASQVFDLQKELSFLARQNKAALDYRSLFVTKPVNQLSPLLRSLIQEVSGIHQQQVLVKKVFYFERIETWLEHQPLDVLKSYLKCFYFMKYASYLDEQAQMIATGKKLTSSEDRALEVMKKLLPNMLAHLYIVDHAQEQRKEVVQAIVKNLKESYIDHLRHNPWLSLNGKKCLLKKISGLKVKIAYPDTWTLEKNLPKIDVHSSLITLVEKIEKWRKQQRQQKIGKLILDNDWMIQPYEINAHYDILRNEIVIPDAILQTPFYEGDKQSIGTLYGTLGVLIGHEMTHAIDLIGIFYNQFGSYSECFPSVDRERYRSKVEKMSTQYQRYAKQLGISLRAPYVQANENIADFGGLSIAYDTLLKQLESKGIDVLRSKQEKKKFFRAWQSLFVDENCLEKREDTANLHSPGQIRAIAPLRNMQGFYEAFTVKKNDPLYLSVNRRLRLW
jgi:neprilysin-2